MSLTLDELKAKKDELTCQIECLILQLKKVDKLLKARSLDLEALENEVKEF